VSPAPNSPHLRAATAASLLWLLMLQLAGARLRLRACGLPQTRARALGNALPLTTETFFRRALRAAEEDVRRGPQALLAWSAARRGSVAKFEAASLIVPRLRRPWSLALPSSHPVSAEVVMRQLKPTSSRQALLAERAYTMRHAPTPSEAALWRLLSGRKLGVAFRRQVPLGGRYVADFLAPSAHLIIEVDGSAHLSRTKPDARRDRRLGKLGYRVLQLDADLVLRHPASAVASIRGALAER